MTDDVWFVMVPEIDRFNPVTGHYTSPGDPSICRWDDDKKVWRHFVEVFGDDAEKRANIIADSFNALRNLVRHLDEGAYAGTFLPEGHPMHAARAAIAKAEGEAP